MKYAFKSLIMLIKKYPIVILLQIISIISTVITTIIPIQLVSKIITMYQNNKSFEEMVKVVIIAFLILLLTSLINVIINYGNAYVERNFKVSLAIKFYKKLDSIDYDFHESPKFLNDYTRALEDGTERIYSCANGILTVLKTMCQSISVFIIIFNMHYLTVVYAVVIGFIYMLIRIRVGKLDFKSMTLQRPFRRMGWYANRIYYVKDAMADLKTSEIDNILLDNNDKSWDEIVNISCKYNKIIAFLVAIGDILITSIYPVTLGILALVTIDNLDVSQFASLTVAATTSSTLVSQLVTSFADIENHAIECKIPFEVLDMKSSIEGIKFIDLKDDFEMLKLENVSFSYDDKKLALHNVTLDIKKGQKIAIVGENGAGKTTLVKLLLRLYDVKDGAIYINGQNYKETTATTIRKRVGAVFQEVEEYAASVAENIIFRKPKDEKDEKLVYDALAFSGLLDYVKKLPDGINTHITREFSRKGTIFSGGQMQRLAISRGYAQNYQLFILDEPSSALDPLSEAQVYNNMLELGKDKTIIFISHRLTTTVNADKIYLFENGTVLESGTHQELMSKNSEYKKMFTSQASKYLGCDYENN